MDDCSDGVATTAGAGSEFDEELQLLAELGAAERATFRKLQRQVLDEIAGGGARTRWSIIGMLAEMNLGQLDQCIELYEQAGLGPQSAQDNPDLSAPHDEEQEVPVGPPGLPLPPGLAASDLLDVDVARAATDLAALGDVDVPPAPVASVDTGVQPDISTKSSGPITRTPLPPQPSFPAPPPPGPLPPPPKAPPAAVLASPGCLSTDARTTPKDPPVAAPVATPSSSQSPVSKAPAEMFHGTSIEEWLRRRVFELRVGLGPGDLLSVLGNLDDSQLSPPYTEVKMWLGFDEKEPLAPGLAQLVSEFPSVRRGHQAASSANGRDGGPALPRRQAGPPGIGTPSSDGT